MENQILDRLYTVREVAEYLRISKSQAYYLVARKEIPSIKVSERRVVIREADLKKWLEIKSEEILPGMKPTY